MLIRILAAIGVGVWCLFLLLVSVVFVIDRGLADVDIVWIALFGIGVVAPVLLLRQINRAIATHEESRRAVPGTKEKEKELLGALEERGGLTAAMAAMRTSLTIDEASKMLDMMVREGHLKLRMEEGAAAYALSGRDTQSLSGQDSPSSLGEEDGEAAGRFVAHERLDDPLSERELEVLTLLASGKTNSEVAGDLFVSVGTVKSHAGNIYRKLGARNRAEALARARDLDLIR
jgi:ATP/maltotriose-dependent transcriptional regulator MalT